MNPNLNNSIEFKIYGIYLLVSLLTPIICLGFFDYWPDEYRYPEINSIKVICISFIMIAAPITWYFIKRNKGLRFRSVDTVKIDKYILLAVLIISVGGFISGSSGWRYSEESVSQRGGAALYLFIVVPTILRLYVIRVFYFEENQKLEINALILAGLIVSINGNMTAISTLMLGFLFFTNAKSIFYKGYKIDLITATISVLVISGLLLVGYVYGESVKRGVDVSEVMDWIFSSNEQNQGWVKQWLLGRMSPSYVSFLHIGDDVSCLSNACGDFNIEVLLRTAIFRISSVFGLSDFFGFQKDINGTIMRINYLVINKFPVNDREGTSPGLAPGFFYAFDFLLGLIALFLYIIFILWFISKMAERMPKAISNVGVIFLTYMLLPLYESPLDFLLILDDGFLYMAGLILMTFLFRKSV